MNAPVRRVTLSGDGARSLFDALKQGEIGAFKAETDVAACLLPLLEAVGWRGGTRQIVEALPHYANTLDMADLRNVLATLGYRTVRKTIKRGTRIDTRFLPCLYQDKEGRPYVLSDFGNDTCVCGYSGRDRAEMRLAQGELEGDLYLIAERDQTIKRTESLRQNWIAGIFRRFRPHVLRLFGYTLFLNFSALAVPLFIMAVYDQVIPSGSLRVLPMLALGIGLVILFEILIRHLRAAMVAHMSGRLEYLIATSVVHQILALPPSLTESSALGNQVSRLREFDSIRELFTGTLVTILLELPFVFLMIGVIAALAGWLAAIPVVMVLAYLIIGAAAMPSLRRKVEAASKARYERHAFLVETMTKMRTIREAGVEGIWLSRFRELDAEAGLAQFGSNQLNQLLQTLAQMVMMLSGLATVGFGVLAVLAGAITLGGLIATMALVWRVLSPLNNLLLTLARAEQIRGAILQINHLMRMSRETVDRQGSSIERSWAGHIALERVSFRYSAASEPALLGVSLQAAPGEMVAIMGSNGAGKSSVLRLILGMYRPQAGQIKLDGLDIRQIDPQELRRTVAYVPQQNHLFHGTLEQNLRLSNPSASIAEIERALRLAGLEEEIRSLPRGLETRVGDQSVWQLNAGFRQRLSLARAYLRDCPVLLMDEPAQALDEVGDRALVATLQELKGRRTIVMVSHRPSHVRLADQLVVLDHGQMILNGPPEDIFAQLKEASI